MRALLLTVTLLLPATANAQDPPWLDALTDSVAIHEGFSATPYLDPPNNPAGWVAAESAQSQLHYLRGRIDGAADRENE